MAVAWRIAPENLGILSLLLLPLYLKLTAGA